VITEKERYGTVITPDGLFGTHFASQFMHLAGPNKKLILVFTELKRNS
jgi:hypothetical protein